MDNNENIEKEIMDKLIVKKEQIDMDLRSIADKLSTVFKIEESGDVLLCTLFSRFMISANFGKRRALILACYG